MTSVSQADMGEAFITFTHLLHKLRWGGALVAGPRHQDTISAFRKKNKRENLYYVYSLSPFVFICFITSFIKKFRGKSVCVCVPPL